MARQYTQPKRLRNVAWFKEKLMLAKAQEAAFQTVDLDAYDSDCDDLSSAKAVLMANLSSCDPKVLSEDTNSSAPNDLLVLYLVEQMTDHIAHLDKENQINKMVVQIVLWYLDSGCSKHMTGNRSQLINFVSKFLGTIRFRNDHIAKNMGYGDYQIGLVRGLPKLKYQIDHLCSAYALGKSKKHSHKPKAKDSIQEKLYLQHMDLYGPMRIPSINGRKYILVIVDDYSRTDNGTEFVNHTLKAYYEEVRILHQTSVARTPQQNGVVERRNRTLVEVARTITTGNFRNFK
ncbi:retrovirus-related pol polyprotein from transposon TNT 1-94 [Tanacetum coccineum]